MKVAKYPTELVDEAREWYGPISNKVEISAIPLKMLADDIYLRLRNKEFKKPESLQLYSAVEIAEMIKDIDRHS